MNNFIFSFIVTFIAGATTMIGVLPIYFKKINEEKLIPACLAFSSGVMICISFFSLIPEGCDLININFYSFPSFILTFIFIVIGILFSIYIDRGVKKRFSNNNLYKLGIISIIVLMLHNIPEGITTFLSTSNNKALGISLSFAIALHNIPEGISIAIPIFYSTKSKFKALSYTFLSGFSEFFGAIFAYIFLKNYINNFLLGAILATTAGVMMHISIYELLPNSIAYKKKRITFISFLIGFFVMLSCKFIFS